ncbi:TPA: Holliday junction resolvase RecU [Clostridium perfringens]|nr:holliday junction-specific endonuclease [Clostridium phage phiCp-D]
MLNEGKKFEQDFKKSIKNDEETFIYRFRDSSGAWGNGDKTRFTPSNIADFLLVKSDKVLFLELKSIKEKRLPLSNIRISQLNGLSEIRHRNIRAYFIVNFRSEEKTYAITPKQILDFLEVQERKSIPLSWFEENGILIKQTKKKVRWKYDLEAIYQ